MRPTAADKRAVFSALHAEGCFVLPNPWDVGSAVILESLGFKALASTSAGYAWSRGRADYKMARDEVLTHLSDLAHAVDIPLNADFENAFADDADGVAENVALAADTGIAGLSVEDSTGDKDSPLYAFDLAVDRIRAARAALDSHAPGLVLTARSEGFLWGVNDLADTTRRIAAYAEAGADCLYAPGLRTEALITDIIGAAGGKPVNVLTPGLPVAALAALGVRRISVGGSLARVAYGALVGAAEEILGEGSFAAFGRVPPTVNLNGVFNKAIAARG
jgi:2-methylisocitrate lyase-like PEP mutase family enzyme